MSAPSLAAPIVRIDEPAYLSERRGSWADDVPHGTATSQSKGKSAASNVTNGAASAVATANAAKKNVQFDKPSAATAAHLTVDRGYDYDEFDDGRRSSWANALLDDEPVGLPQGFDSAKKRKSSVGLLHFVSLDREDRQSDRLMMATPPLSPEGDTSRRSGGDYFGTPRTPTAGSNGARTAGMTTTTPSRKQAAAATTTTTGAGGEQKDETSLASVLSGFSIGNLFNSAVEAFSHAGAAIDPLGGREDLIAEQRRKAKGKGRALDPIDPLAPPLSSNATVNVNGTPASARANGHANGHAGHSDSIRSIDDVMVGGSSSSGSGGNATAGRQIDSDGPALRSLPTSPVAVSGYPVASSSRMMPPPLSPLVVHRQPYSPPASSPYHAQSASQQANIYARAQGEKNSSLEAALNSTFDGVEKKVKGVWNWFGQPGMGL